MKFCHLTHQALHWLNIYWFYIATYHPFQHGISIGMIITRPTTIRKIYILLANIHFWRHNRKVINEDIRTTFEIDFAVTVEWVIWYDGKPSVSVHTRMWYIIHIAPRTMPSIELFGAHWKFQTSADVNSAWSTLTRIAWIFHIELLIRKAKLLRQSLPIPVLLCTRTIEIKRTFMVNLSSN